MALHFDQSLDIKYRTIDEVVPGVRRIVAENPGPYTFKGSATFIVGRGEVAVIDPGPADERHIDALLAALGTERVSHILVTHTHLDHSPGTRLLQERTGAKTYGFGPHPVPSSSDEERFGEAPSASSDSSMGLAGDSSMLAGPISAALRVLPERPFRPASRIGDSETTSERESKANGKEDSQADGKATDAEKADAKAEANEAHGDTDFAPDVPTNHGDLIVGEGWEFEAVHTPGHLANHLCFRLAREKLLFTGDHVMGWSTSVISPPGGNLNHYLASLVLLLASPDAVYIPTHGSPIRDPHDFVRGLIDHRNARTAQILDRLQSGPQTISEIVAALYVGLNPKLLKAAGRSVLAHLDALVGTGSVVPDFADDSARMISACYRLT
jgi:glyoxylase-like metal-dependent hydrolase (beta-lactamase superfamily II)